eukprot:Platyproteum_vivax@DN3375_c0_g1_i1.p1
MIVAPVSTSMPVGFPSTPVASPMNVALVQSPQASAYADSPLFDSNAKHELLLSPLNINLATLPHRRVLIDPAGPIYLLSRSGCAVLGVPGYDNERNHLMSSGIWSPSPSDVLLTASPTGANPVPRFMP